mgnify:CR=1 FL=1
MGRDNLALLGGPKAFTREEELKEACRWPKFGEEEKRAAMEVLESDNIYDVIREFEADFARYMGAKYALAHNNGTSSIHAAYFAVGVGPGDEVLTSAYTWHLQVSQILALHALPVFVDVNPKDGNMDPEDLERKITPRTKAIAVVHVFGAVAPMDEIMEVARKHGIPVIEDCSHAHGAEYKGRKVGTIGDVGCFSLQNSKLMTGIEGGVLVTNNKEYYERAIVLGHYERIPELSDPKLKRFVQREEVMAPSCFGFKYRIHPVAAAIARVQLRHLDEWNRVRRRNITYLNEKIGSASDGFVPPYEAPGTKRTWLNYLWQYFPEKMEGVPRERFIDALIAEGVSANRGRAGYLPVYWNPLYEEKTSMWGPGYPFDAPYVEVPVEYERGMCPVAEEMWKRMVGLPVIHWEVGEDLLDELAEAVIKVVENVGQLK